MPSPEVAAELVRLECYKRLIENYKMDISALAGISPYDALEFLQKKLDQFIVAELEPTDPEYEHKKAYRAEAVQIFKAEVELDKLAALVDASGEWARKKTEYYQAFLLKITSHFKPVSIFDEIDLTPDFEKEKFISPLLSTWTAIKKILPRLKSEIVFEHVQHNSLAQLLFLDDDEFSEKIREFGIVLSDEIGLIMLARLWDIAHSEEVTALTQRQAKRALYSSAGQANISNMLMCHFDALYGELTKLHLHATLHPEILEVWIGTARAVNAKALTERGKAIYLNPTPRLNSWILNRFWLETAVGLGYRVNLAEQHFPAIESTILSGRSHLLLSQLAFEMRAPGLTSQYNGDDAPTATSQEILALIHMGCIAHRNLDHSIAFMKRTTSIVFDDLPEVEKRGGLKKTHSSPMLTHVSAPPSLVSKLAHFKPPTKEEAACHSEFDFLMKESWVL